MNRFFFLAMGMLTLVAIGCDSQSQSVEVEEPVNPYVLTSRPEGVSGLIEVAESLDAGELPSNSQPIMLIGKIDAGDFSAFEKGQATFMLSELPAEGHGADDPDHEDNCPFCKRRAGNAPKAVVSIVGSDGNALPTDARELLGVKQGDRVIAVGAAAYDKSLNTITMESDRVYLGPW